MKANQPLLSALFVALPFVYLASIYGDLPAVIPIHFDWRGVADGFGPKWLLWLLPVLGMGLMLIVTASMRKRTRVGGAMAKQAWLGVVTLAFISLLFCYIIRAAEVGGNMHMGGLSILLGALFAAQGNYFPVLDQNRWVGIRVPATLRSVENWRRAHRFAGPVFVAGGLLMVVNGLVFSSPVVNVVMFALLAIIVVVPLVYAFRLPAGGDEPPSDFV